MQLKSGGDFIEWKEEIVRADIDEQQSLCLHHCVIIQHLLFALFFMDGASVVLDDGLQLLIDPYFVGYAEWDGRYEETCCLQMGQFLC